MGPADGGGAGLQGGRDSAGAGWIFAVSDALSHRPVLLDEAVGALNIQPAGVYVDATFGRGGHSREILSRLGSQGCLIALDRDPAAVQAAEAIRDCRFRIVQRRFSRMAEVLRELGVERVDGVLFDLGVSSPQLEDASRGFSFRLDGPLDMRMDPGEGPSAAQWLARATEREIGEVVRRYGEERFAKQIARAIVAARARKPVATTRELAAIVAQAVRTREPGQDPATRTFQALRIFINQELEELPVALEQALGLLKPGGRLVVISFHSLEDRIVKRFMQAAARPGDVPAKLPLKAHELPRPRARIVGKALRASAAEVAANPRARSAVLRVAERLGED
ncbi:16S rRNA (cytosine(1402)-N(4))-methyltransferase RsmH [Pelomicrobium methylotrophicum]|uniref:Ribosomal RNA small subunit methyltransferase H n=1 Tax=Pelomicrobium methylotrophicum TaxID=2602750 RepID=A0A5C7EKR2_9PROT|nr:16S rRNA (cytosine(1402)-N(4))-methyltransferase RsmH [Pelomicrobium methylotrophicum]